MRHSIPTFLWDVAANSVKDEAAGRLGLTIPLNSLVLLCVHTKNSNSHQGIKLEFTSESFR